MGRNIEESQRKAMAKAAEKAIDELENSYPYIQFRPFNLPTWEEFKEDAIWENDGFLSAYIMYDNMQHNIRCAWWLSETLNWENVLEFNEKDYYILCESLNQEKERLCRKLGE